MENVKIIEWNPSDSLQCIAVTDLINQYIQDKMGGGTPLNYTTGKKLIDGLKNHPSKLILLAKHNEEFVGLTVCFINFATFTVKPFINIHDIVVHKASRNKGIGRKLIEEVVVRAKNLECSKITLEVREDNINAQHLYQSLGFEESEPKMYFWNKYF